MILQENKDEGTSCADGENVGIGFEDSRFRTCRVMRYEVQDGEKSK